MIVEVGNDALEFTRQAAIARALGSPFVANVLEAGQRQIALAPTTATMIANWSGDQAQAAVAMRFNGALHALARNGAFPALTELYRCRDGDFDAAIGEALTQEDGFVATWMRSPPQTNEVGRAAAIFAALMVASRQWGMPFELLELGSSAGLNLNLARYRYRLGGLEAGASASQVDIVPEWRGVQPVAAHVDVESARGVDVQPLDAADKATCDRLMAYVWADQPERADRLKHAIALARTYPPRIEQGDAASWLERQLRARQRDGVCRVVFHSMVLQYLSVDDKARVAAAIAAARHEATLDRPFVRISYEWNAARTEVELILTSWPDGAVRRLATCHPYAAWIDWEG